MVVQHNITAVNANRYFGINNNKLSKSLEKLSSGYAINRAGDNAAGLAVSEKMRSQIAGINQGVKNAQDGISMIQTFEGALTETDSILQRMKVLADQSANGTYQNEVDRDAIQLEFNQLNDELNQIADTDFNGVVVLNGGQMSDGLKQVDGKFDYSLKQGQVAEANAQKLADAQKAAQEKIDNAQKAFDSAKAVYDSVQKRDLGLEGKALGFNSLDNSQYDKKAADALFNKTADGAAAAADKSNVLSNLTDEIEIAYIYDETDGWKIDAANSGYYDKDGKWQSLEDSLGDATNGLKGVLDDANIETTANGGFIVGTGTAAAGSSADAVYGNVVLDTSNVKAGDTVVLKYSNPASTVAAPTNIGIDKDSLNNGVDDSIPTLKLNTDYVKDENMDADLKAALDALNNSEIEFSYDSTTIKPTISDDKLSIAQKAGSSTDFEISYKDAKGNSHIIATVSTAKAHGVTAAPTLDETKSLSTNIAAGSTFTATFDGTKWVGADGNAVATGSAIGGATLGADLAGVINGVTTANYGDKITITSAGDGAGANGNKYTAKFEAAPATTGSIKFGVALDHGQWSAAGPEPTIDVGKSHDATVTDATEIDKNYAATKAALEEAKAAYPKTVDDLNEEAGVSKSDAYDQATAPLTYQDHIMLQAGARTKDLVDFTFKYTSDGLGDLKADLDCSARGLGTDKLSLATQEDANYAIDRIDNAINKTNMVRATFGAVQNRLEHKIDNLNVTSENLTSAESRIRDTNMAEEMMNFTKNQILAQASQSMLAQANQLPQGVLSLLQ